MSSWEKVHFEKTYKDYSGIPVLSLLKKTYTKDGVSKNTYRVSFNGAATVLLSQFIRYDGKIVIDIVSSNAGVRVGIVKGDTFECKYRFNRSMLEICNKNLLEYLESRYGVDAKLKLVPTENGVIELVSIGGIGDGRN